MSSKKSGFARYIAVLKESFVLAPNLFFIRLFLLLLGTAQVVVNLVAPKYLLLALKDLNFKYFLIALLVLSGSNFCITGLISLVNPIVSKMNESFNAKIVDGFLKKSIVISLSTFEESGFYDKYTLAFDKCCEIFQTSINTFFQILQSVGQIFIVIIILSWMHPLYLGVLFVFALIQTIIGNQIKRINYDFQKKIITNKKKLNYLYRLFYIPEFMRDVRVNTLSDLIFKKKDDAAQCIVNGTYHAQAKTSKKKILQSAFSFGETMIVMSYFGYMVIMKNIWYDTFVISQNSYNQMKTAIMDLLSVFNTLYENDLFAKEFFEFMNSTAIETSGSMHLTSDIIREIEFRNVSFSYPNSIRKSIRNMSFKIAKGEKILITGRNGAGKTTAIKLLLRLYTPTSGQILINGIDISLYDLNELRQSIAVLFQDYTIYAFSIYENLCLNKIINQDAIASIIDDVGLAEFISNLKNGLDTPVSCQIENAGVDMSGGEKQKIALGRILLKKKSVIVFDEPTSNLDPQSVQSLISNILQDESHTIVIISHQLSFAREMSKILCFDRGTIVESGKHEDLLEKDGMYANLYNRFLRSQQ